MLACLVSLLLAAGAAHAEDQGPEAAGIAAEQAGRLPEALQQYLAALRVLPDPPPPEADLRLRERVIRLVQRMDPPPPVPEDAHRYALRAQAALKLAQDSGGFERAALELRKAVQASPWWGDVLFNLVLVQEKLQQYDAAMANAKLYLLAAPDSPDAKGMRDKLVQLEYSREEVHAPGRVHVLWHGRFLVGSLTVRCDGLKLAKVNHGHFFTAIIEPGSHTFKLDHGNDVALEVKPHAEHFLGVTPAGLLGVSHSLKTLSDEEGRAEIRKLQPIDTGRVIDRGRVAAGNRP